MSWPLALPKIIEFRTTTRRPLRLSDWCINALMILLKVTNPMPVARLCPDPRPPAPLTEEEATFIKQIVQRFHGPAAIVRNHGPLPSRLDLHIELDKHGGAEKCECICCALDANRSRNYYWGIIASRSPLWQRKAWLSAKCDPAMRTTLLRLTVLALCAARGGRRAN